MTNTKVLVVDDSPTMRRLISLRLDADPRIEVVGEACDAAQARQKLRELNPDVMTLDVEMPGQSGLDFLAQLMRMRPIPVIMVSTETQKGSVAAIEALSLGAVDCIGKPINPTAATAFDRLPDMVVMAAGANIRLRPAANTANAAASAPVGESSSYIWNGKLVMIGSSTGGVDALERIVSELPPNCPPVLITQHMPEAFLASFAHRLNQQFAPKIQLAENGMPIEQGNIYLAPGGDYHLRIDPGLQRSRCELWAGPKRSSHRPSVDVMLESAAPIAERCVSIILTGMGSDGAEGQLVLRQRGAVCLAQDEASSVVWGMPRMAWQNGAAERLVPLDEIAQSLIAETARGNRRRIGRRA